jgi:peptidoglycan hydrolase-like protein with peptidoglycan-binding domain
VHPLSKYVGITLKLWSKGEAVSALQKAIGKLTVDGSYGPATEARVKEYQKSKGLTVTGVTDSKVWLALIGAERRRGPCSCCTRRSNLRRRQARGPSANSRAR